MRTILLSHNKTAYQKVMRAFGSADRTCVVHPTGTGKSYLIAAVSESFKRVMILGPNTFVLDQLPPPVYAPKYYNTRQRGLRSHAERYGYMIIKDRGDNLATRYVIFYTTDTKRNERYEQKCHEAGLEIKEYKQ